MGVFVMSHLTATKTNRTGVFYSKLGEQVEAHNFEPQTKYLWEVTNLSNREGQLVLPSITRVNHTTEIFANEDGKMPFNVASNDSFSDWERGLRTSELTHDIINEGYYKIWVFTSRFLSNTAENGYEFFKHTMPKPNDDDEKTTHIVIARIGDLTNVVPSDAGVSQIPLTVEYTGDYKTVLDSVKEKDNPLYELMLKLIDPVRFAVTRMVSNDIYEGSVPKYSISLGRLYTQRLFTRDQKGHFISEYKGKKLSFNYNSLKQFTSNEDVQDTNQLLGGIFTVYLTTKHVKNPTKQLLIVDGFRLPLITFHEEEYLDAFTHYRTQGLDLVRAVMDSGYHFDAVIRNDQMFALYQGLEGVCELKLTTYEAEQVKHTLALAEFAPRTEELIRQQIALNKE